jgi:phosphatidate cytidylyltransferase
MLRQRIITALLLLPVALAIILLLPTWLFGIVIGLLLLLAGWEWTALAGLRGTPARAVFLAGIAVALAALWLAHGSSLWPVIIVLGVVWWLVCCLWLRHYAYGAAPTRENIALKLAVGVLLLVPTWIAALDIHGSPDHGHGWTLVAIVIVWAADTGAYFSGRLFGKRKLAPQISPGKTWAGVYGALLFGALFAGLGAWLLDVRGVQLAGMVVLGLLVVAASVVGDLLESLMKRQAQVKDSGTLFPGHGGLLDRMDSVFAALPVFAIGKLLLGL